MPRLLLVGGGHAMLPSFVHAHRWVQRGIEVTLINDGVHLYYSGMVPEHLGGVYTRDEIRIDLRALCRRHGVHFVDQRVVSLDVPAQQVTTDDGAVHGFDLAAFDVGVKTPATPDAAIPTKPLYRLNDLAAWLDAVCQETSDAPSQRLVIAGGGAAGTEIALNVAARARITNAPLQINLVEPGDDVLPAFPTSMRRYLHGRLVALGVTVHPRRRIDEVATDHVTLSDGSTLPVDALLWATGTTGYSLFQDAGLACTDDGFVHVNEALQCLGAPRVFAAGDCAVVRGHEDLARIGVHAVKQGPVLRDNLDTALDALGAGRTPNLDDLRPFRPYPVAPLILSTGTDEAVWASGAVWMRGRLLLRLKHLVDRRFMRRYAAVWQQRSLLDLIDADHASLRT